MISASSGDAMRRTQTFSAFLKSITLARLRWSIHNAGKRLLDRALDSQQCPPVVQDNVAKDEQHNCYTKRNPVPHQLLPCDMIWASASAADPS
jgi:hypothetical protein